MQSLTREELKSLIQAVPNPRQRLMLKVGFHHGLRVSEIIGLDDTNIRDGYVKVQRLKGSMKTIQPFMKDPDPLLDEAEELGELSRTLKAGEKLFPMTRFGVHKLMQRAGKRAGLPAHKLHPHVLKHSIAMQTIHKAGIENVRQWLGHKNISSTGSYLIVSDEVAAVAIAGAMSSSPASTEAPRNASPDRM